MPKQCKRADGSWCYENQSCPQGLPVMSSGACGILSSTCWEWELDLGTCCAVELAWLVSFGSVVRHSTDDAVCCLGTWEGRETWPGTDRSSDRPSWSSCLGLVLSWHLGLIEKGHPIKLSAMSPLLFPLPPLFFSFTFLPLPTTCPLINGTNQFLYQYHAVLMTSI